MQDGVRVMPGVVVKGQLVFERRINAAQAQLAREARPRKAAVDWTAGNARRSETGTVRFYERSGLPVGGSGRTCKVNCPTLLKRWHRNSSILLHFARNDSECRQAQLLLELNGEQRKFFCAY
jgi:hypothetical protein